MPGKEEFSDALRKVLRDQYPNTVIVCWGHPKKGGDKGKHYHVPLVSRARRATVQPCLWCCAVFVCAACMPPPLDPLPRPNGAPHPPSLSRLPRRTPLRPGPGI